MKKLLLFSVIFVTGYFIFGHLNIAQAACSYDVNFDVNPKTVQFDGKVSFTTKVAVTGNDSGGADCRDSIKTVYIKYFVTSAASVSTQPFFGLNTITESITISLNNGRGENVRDYYLNNFFTQDAKDKNSGKLVYYPVNSGSFFVRLYEAGGAFSSNVQTSGIVPIVITAPSNYPQLTQPSPVSSGDLFGCKANGVYACATQTDSPDIAACPKPIQPISNSCWCGKTEEQIQTQCVGGATTPISPGTSTTPVIPTNQNSDCTDPNKCLYNPLPTDALTDMLLLIMQGFLMIIGIWSVAFVIIGGFRYVMSQGNEEAVTAARKTITWAIVGLIIALMSFSIIAIVKNIFKVDTKTVNTGK